MHKGEVAAVEAKSGPLKIMGVSEGVPGREAGCLVCDLSVEVLQLSHCIIAVIAIVSQVTTVPICLTVAKQRRKRAKSVIARGRSAGI